MKGKTKTYYIAGVYTGTSDYGTVGPYPTERGAIRAARKLARAAHPLPWYKGYGPKIAVHEYVDGHLVARYEYRAW